MIGIDVVWSLKFSFSSKPDNTGASVCQLPSINSVASFAATRLLPSDQSRILPSLAVLAGSHSLLDIHCQ
ncbi:hypothetical protein LNP74_15885 [Klebsiella pneumoniae subsp. pneumoniae]|nr:hypothetical protein [Klebsiella pneumoniae subsp. pneumoniae]